MKPTVIHIFQKLNPFAEIDHIMIQVLIFCPQLSDLCLNRIEEDSPQFALHSSKTDRRTFEAKSVEVKNVWCDLLAKICKQYGR